MDNHHELTEMKGADMLAHFYIDGVRVSREKYEHIEQMGFMYGRVSTYHTKARPVGTKTRRTNYKTVQY